MLKKHAIENMADIDKKIRQALSAEDEKLFEDFGEEKTVFELMAMSFQGRMHNFMIIAWVAMFAVFGLAIYSATQYFSTQEVLDRITWAVGFLVSMQFLMGMKIWYWLELSKLATLRDIRRLELRVALHDE